MKISWLLGGNIVYAISQFLVLIILARFFSSQEIGEYFFCLALITPFVLIFSIKLSNLIVTLERSETEYKDIFGFRLILNFLLLSIIYIIYFIFFQDKISFFILTSVLVYKIFEQYDDLIIAYNQRDFKFRDIFILKLLRSFVYVFAIYLNSYFFDSFEKAIFFATFLYIIYWIFRNYKYLIVVKFNRNLIANYLENGLYLSISSAVSSLNVSGVRLYVGYVLGTSVLAIYGVISYSLIAFGIIVSALGQYFLPIFVNLKNNKKEFYKKILKSQIIVIGISLSFIIISYVFGNKLLNIFYGNQYESYGYFLFLVFVANLFKSSSSLLGTAMTALKVYNFQLKITIISLFFTLILTPILIMNFNILGAFLSLLLVNIIEWILYIFFFKRKSKGVLL